MVYGMSVCTAAPPYAVGYQVMPQQQQQQQQPVTSHPGYNHTPADNPPLAAQ